MLKVRRRVVFSSKWFIIIASLVVAVAVGIFLAVDIIETPRTNAPEVAVQEATPPKPQVVTSNILVTGNSFWGRRIDDWSAASPLKYAYPFSRLNEFNRDQYDAWITGLECPSVPGVEATAYEEQSLLKFNCSTDYLPEAAKWFTAVTLANNHTDNQGAAGFAATKAELEKNQIQYFGHYDPTVLDDVCEVIALPVTITNDDGSSSKGKLPVAMCGYHGVFRIPPKSSVAVMKNYSPYMPVLALPHMGTEYRAAPDQLKTSFYRSLIDGGADVVLGDHPHWVQTTESYKGHLIVYSMGNFIFDQQTSAEVTRSAAIQIVIDSSSDTSEMLKSWLSIGEQCANFKDDCLPQIKNQGLTKLNLTYKFNVVGTDSSNQITKPADSSLQNAILERLNWQTTMDNLQVPYSKL